MHIVSHSLFKVYKTVGIFQRDKDQLAENAALLGRVLGR